MPSEPTETVEGDESPKDVRPVLRPARQAAFVGPRTAAKDQGKPPAKARHAGQSRAVLRGLPATARLRQAVAPGERPTGSIDATPAAVRRQRRLARQGKFAGPQAAPANNQRTSPAVARHPAMTRERVALRKLPVTATLRDVIQAVLGERPVGHAHTYANVVLTQHALARLAGLMAGHAFAPWEPEPWPGERSEAQTGSDTTR